jgi:hypothetical protein
MQVASYLCSRFHSLLGINNRLLRQSFDSSTECVSGDRAKDALAINVSSVIRAYELAATAKKQIPVSQLGHG